MKISFSDKIMLKRVEFMKKARTALVVLAVLLAGLFLWYYLPIDLLDLKPEEVMEISVFNGSTGKVTHITDEEQIKNIIDDLNDIKVRREKLSTGYSGFSFKITIYMSDGNEADGWNNFIINSENTVRKDPFFYKTVEGEIDYEYIESITE